MAETQAKHRHSAGQSSPGKEKSTQTSTKSKSAKAPAKAKLTKTKTSTRKGGAKRAGKKRRSILRLIRESWFYRIYFALLLLCAVGLAVGLTTLYGVMEEYEATRPVHCAEQVLDIVEAGDWAQLQSLDESARAFKYDAPEQYALAMDALTQGAQFSLKSIVTIDENEPQYNLMMDGKKFAELTLEHSGETTRHNFEHWKLKSLRTQALSTKTYTITVPSDDSVQVNGLALGEEDILERDIAVIDSANLPEGVAAPTLTKYGVSMLSGEPGGLRVTDRNGAEQELTRDEDGNYSRSLSWDDEKLKAACEAPVVQWSRRLAAYTTGDYNKFDLSNACVNPSPARTYIRNMENNWAAKHSGYDFHNMETRNYYLYSDSCFSCEISFDYIVHYTKEDKSYPTKYTLFFVRSGGGFKLYSFTMN